MAVVTVARDPLAYADWRAWRAMRTAPKTVHTETHRSTCPRCAGAGAGYEVILRRHPDLARMAIAIAARPHFLLVLCAECGGQGALTHVVAVVVS